jgi:hypothetical protein
LIGVGGKICSNKFCLIFCFHENYSSGEGLLIFGFRSLIRLPDANAPLLSAALLHTIRLMM